MISVLNLFKVRILHGHFDWSLHIRRSGFYDFAVSEHEEAMKVIICWLKSTAHGDTTLSTVLPVFRHGPLDEVDDGSDDIRESAGPARTTLNISDGEL